MEPTPESLFERHLASQSEGDFEDALAAEIEAFAALLEEHPQHAKELTRLRDAQRSESQGSSGPLVGDLRAAEGVTIGDFQLVKKLGRGGMGEVWEAEQASLSRRVALKLLPAAGSERAQEFFAREARAGGRLNHPGIVSVMGTGEDEGARWISMELVEGGRTLRDFLDEMRAKEELPESYYPEIAELFAKIAEAMAVAHEAGVIHRDLKPANIMVTGEGEPKVADFGLARVLDEQGLSQSGEVMGTFYYMSPEQVKAARGGVDHRADVFSLGALFYEALVMARPFEGDTTLQIVEKILNHDPPDPKALRSRVPEDLAVICIKALEKAREGRYDSMTELAADLRHHLADEPIMAQPPSTWKRTVKWARRNPTKSVAGAVAAAAFVAISGLAWQLQEKTDEAVANAERAEANAEEAAENEEQAKRSARQAEVLLDLATANAEAAEESAAAAEVEREKAARRAEDLQQISAMQSEQLSGVDPEAMGQTLFSRLLEVAKEASERSGAEEAEVERERAELREALRGTDFTSLAVAILDEHVFARALRSIEGLDEQPLIQATLYQSAADSMRTLGMLEQANGPQEKALEIRRRELGEEANLTIESISAKGSLLHSQGEYEAGVALKEEALEKAQLVLGLEHPFCFEIASGLAGAHGAAGNHDLAKQLFQPALEGIKRTRGEQSKSALSCANGLGSTHTQLGEYEKAEEVLSWARETAVKTFGRESPLATDAATNLASLYMEIGRGEEAEVLMRDALEVQRRRVGETHNRTLALSANLAIWLDNKGAFTEAEPLYRLGLEALREGRDHPDVQRMVFNYAIALSHRGRRVETVALWHEALESLRRMTEAGDPATFERIADLGTLLDPAEAEPYFREALEGFRQIYGDMHLRTLQAMVQQGHELIALGEHREAEALYREALGGRLELLGAAHHKTLEAMHCLGLSLARQNRLRETEPFYRKVLLGRRRVLGETDTETLKSTRNLASVLFSMGRVKEAEALALKFVQDAPESHPSYASGKGLLERIQASLAVEDGR